MKLGSDVRLTRKPFHQPSPRAASSEIGRATETETCAGCFAGNIADQQDGQDAECARGGTRREIEFAADHQQRDGDRHDAKRRSGLVEDRLGTTGLAELDRDGPEENPHSDSANGCTDLGSNECSLEDPSVRQPLVGVRGCAAPAVVSLIGDGSPNGMCPFCGASTAPDGIPGRVLDPSRNRP